jgi:plasmid stability protein
MALKAATAPDSLLAEDEAMARVILDHLDPEVEHLLRLRAERTGRSLEREAEIILIEALATKAEMTPSDRGRGVPPKRAVEDEVREILALGQRLAEPFDLKRFSDALSDGVE